MSNVLPPEALRKVRQTNAARLALIASLSIGMCALLSIIVLIPAYMVITSESKALANAPEEPLSAAEKKERDEIAKTRNTVKDLLPVANATSTTPSLDLLRVALRERPAGIVLTSFIYQKGQTHSLLVRGNAASRELINAYRLAIQKDPLIKNTNVPLESLTGAEGDFSMTLVGSF